MKRVVEIESAIKKLSPSELSELEGWWGSYSLKRQEKQAAKYQAIKATAGYLIREDAADFEASVNEAAN